MPKFNVHFSDSTYRDLEAMAEQLDVSMAEVIREALSIYRWMIKESVQGSRLLAQRGDQPPTQLVIPYLERLRDDARDDSVTVGHPREPENVSHTSGSSQPRPLLT